MSPFEADLGYVPRSVPDRHFECITGSKTLRDAYEFGRKQQEVLEQLHESLEKAQERMKRYYDHNRPVQTFEVGDQVMISTQNLDIEHLGISRTAVKKFGPLWVGPYSVQLKTTIETYRLELPTGLRLYPEFHTSLLKPYQVDRDPNRWNKPNEGMIAAGGVENSYLIESIVGHKRARTGILYQVKWLGYPTSENSWEPLENLRLPASDLIKSYLDKNSLNCRRWMPPPQRNVSREGM